MTGLPRLAGGVAVLAAAGLLVACTSSGKHAPATASAPSTPVSSPAAPSGPSGPVPPSSPTIPSAPPSSSSSAASSAPASSSSSSAAAGPRTTCTSVQIRVIRGSAIAGQEIAALQFTNTGSSPCLLAGYATVTLLRAGEPIGDPSQPISAATTSRLLNPGDVAESLLHNYTQNCQAPLSDTIRVVAPGMSVSAERPAQLRACTLRVDQLGPPE